MNEPTGRPLVGIVAHTKNNPARRYFEDHPTRRPRWHARNGEARHWGELINPEIWHRGHEARP